jgi:hypothetical protein
MGRQRRKLENGTISTKSPDTTLMNVAQKNHCWLRLKKTSRTLTQTMIWSRIREIGSLMKNLVLPSLLQKSNPMS